MTQLSSSSPSPSRRGLGGLRKHSSGSHRNLFSGHQAVETSGHRPNLGLSPSSLPSDQPPSRRSISSSLQSNTSSSNQTPPGTWSVSGKLVRKKASGLFREAARSWGRSKSKEVLTFGLGVLIGTQDSSTQQLSSPSNIATHNSNLNTANPASPHQPSLSPPPNPSSPTIQPQTPDKSLQPQATSNSVGNLIKGPKKRISFHGPKKLKGKSNENSKLVKRRSEIGFGDWADTLNTAVASSSPQPLINDHSTQTSDCQLHPCPPLNHSTFASHLSPHSPDPMAIPLRRRDRSFNLSSNLAAVSSIESESFSSNATSRVPRSTFPHAHRSPRSPRRFYNTRSAVQRNQSSLNPPSDPLFALQTSTPQANTTHTRLTQYQQSAPLTSSPFKRSVSPINQFEDDFDVESPIASKSHGRPPPASELQLRAASSARANLFGAMPNRSGGLEPSSSSDSVSSSSTPQAAQPSYHLPLWTNGSSTHSSSSTASVPRSRLRTVSATLQEHSSRLQAQYLTTLSENGCDSDPEVSNSAFGSPSSSPSRSLAQDFLHSNRTSSSACQQTAPHNIRAHQVERWVMPRIEGLDMTPRRSSLDESCEESDPDEKITQVGSSKPSSTTSILSCLTTQDLNSHTMSRSSNISLKTTLGGFDAFGALPPPASPFPGPPRIKRVGPSASPASPNNLKRDVDGELVGFASQPNLYRHRINGQTPTCSLPSLRLKSDPFESAQPAQRDSWGQQSICLSDDDDDGAEAADHNDGDVINGSHESHEGASNLSVPGLTDSSSLASSLASSNQSSHTPNLRPPGDGAALLSTTWDKSSNETGRQAKRRSLPTNVGRTPSHNFTPVPPLPIGLVPTPISTKHSLHRPHAPLVQSIDSSFQENESSFQNVKPNASAFLSTGMKSKKSVARDKREQSFGSSSALIQYALLNVSDPNTSLTESNKSMSGEASIAVKSMCEALGGPRVIVAAMREDEAHQQRLVEQYEQSCSMQSATHAYSPSNSPLGIILPDSLRKPSFSSKRMPDTPIKKPFVLHKSNSHINKPFVPSGLSKQSNAYLPSIDGSPIDNSPSSRGHQFLVPESPIQHFQTKLEPNPLTLKSQKTPAIPTASPQNIHCDINPSPSLNRSAMIGQMSTSFDSLSRHSPVFRRRSSDAVLSNHAGTSNLNKTSGPQQNNPFDEAGTPTKVASGWLKRAPQLLTSPSPGNSICSVTNSPSMHHHLQVDQLASGNSSLEHMTDPQVTPNRTGTRSYNSFITSPTTGVDFRQVSSANLTPGPDHLASPSTLPPHSNRYASPTVGNHRHQREGISFVSQFPSGGRFESEFDVVETIGNGEFGEVYKARLSCSSKVYAVKRAKRTANGPKALGRQYEEVDILRRLTLASTRSPHIIQFYDAWEHSNRWYIQTEFCENGTLERFLELIAGLQDRVDEERIWKITSELAQAVAFMHSRGVLHLDIKPANIFITAHGGLKVGDFGLARRWPRINPNDVRECGLLNGRHKLYQYVPTNSSNPDVNSLIPSRFLRYEDVADTEERHMMRFKNCGRFVGFDLEREGDREYIAPEILSGRYGEEADVFSVGLIALEISTNVVLPDNGDEWRALRSSDFSRTDLSHLSSELVLLIKRMMDKCPDRRITATELVQHPVLSKLNGLRHVGLADELNEEPDRGEQEQSEAQPDNAGDIQMTLCEDLMKEPIEPLRPAPPSDNLWRAARGAVLPEAEGFLPFILTGESAPSNPITDHLKTQQVLHKAEINDAMEIDV